MSSKKKIDKLALKKITKEVSKAPVKDIPIKAKSDVSFSLKNVLNKKKYHYSLDGTKYLVSNKPKVKRLKLYVWNIGGEHSLFYALAYSLNHARKILLKDKNIKGNLIREKRLATSPVEFKRPTSMLLTF